jgi:hypothetical protein
MKGFNMLKVKSFFWVVMTFLLGLATGQVQAKNLDVNVINEGPALSGYKLKLEIRKFNDPIYEHEIDLKIPASSREKFSVVAALEKHLPDGFVPASNTIVHLIKDGQVVATNLLVHSYKLDQFGGYQVKINTNDIHPGDVRTKAISIVATSDAAGMVPLHQ